MDKRERERERERHGEKEEYRYRRKRNKREKTDWLALEQLRAKASFQIMHLVMSQVNSLVAFFLDHLWNKEG